MELSLKGDHFHLSSSIGSEKPISGKISWRGSSEFCSTRVNVTGRVG
jgi:hypothetical protein